MGRSRWIGAAIVVAMLAMSGCAPERSASAPSPSSSADDAIAEFCRGPAVAECERGDAFVVVTVANSADEQQTIHLARELRVLAEAEELGNGASLRRESADAAAIDPDVTTPPAWEFSVYPGDAGDIEGSVSGLLAVEQVEGTLGAGVSGGWPHVTVASIDDFAAVFDAVAATPLFRDGGTYTLWSVDERLRIVHTPKWFSGAGIAEVIDLASAYPAAEVLLEAPEGGSQPPVLYVSRLTPDEVAAIDARLSQPALARASVEGGAIEYVLGTTGSDGATYTGGTFGGTAVE
ncbi:hypothetical protein ACFXP7_06440 [Microbacterium sp. P06]|uniref:hypothetical protein n=1 Tax=Microbacterium sp. P06 TaxID=3366949 RepID=UPI003745C6AD